MEYGSATRVDIREDAPLNPHMHDTTYNLAFLANLGWMELTIIGVILLLLFGRRLPEVGRSLGQGIVEFKKGLKDVTEDIKHEVDTAASTKKSEPAKFDSAKYPTGGESMGTAHSSATQMQAEPDPARPSDA
jgi:TatA/E family protein of Tat protein translocase